MSKFDLFDLALIVLIFVHLFAAPYTKVEESFNVHAIYDFVHNGFDIEKFNHIQFPGAVPRTFLGALFYSFFTNFYKVWFFKDQPTLINLQTFARGVLGVFNAMGFIYLRHSAIDMEVWAEKVKAEESLKAEEDSDTKKDSDIKKDSKTEKDSISTKRNNTLGKSRFALIYGILSVTQFHTIFYSSRFLPNFLALPLTNIALGLIIRQNFPLAFGLLAFTSIVFRIELVAFLGSLFFVSTIIFGKAPFFNSITGISAGFATGGVLSFAMDSKMWKPEVDILEIFKVPAKGMIPEIQSFVFNVVHDQAKNWGTEPFSAYFYHYLHRIFFPHTFYTIMTCCVIGVIKDCTFPFLSITIVGISSLLHVLIMSIQGHKEWRFIVYAVPGITLLMSSGINWLQRAKFWHLKLASLIVFGYSVVSLFTSFFALYVSSTNYPGGVAISNFNDYILSRYNNNTLPLDHPYVVHLDVLPKMTGATLFTEFNPEFLANHNISLVYDKTEDYEKLAKLWPDFDFVITNTNVKKTFSIESASNFKEQYESNTQLPAVPGSQWVKIDTIQSFVGINMKPLFSKASGKLDPVSFGKQVFAEVLETKDPITIAKKLATQMILKKDIVYVYEKQTVI